MKLSRVPVLLLCAGMNLVAGGQEFTAGVAGGGGKGSSPSALAHESYSGPAFSYALDLNEAFQFSASFMPRHQYGLTYGSYGAGAQWVHGAPSKAWFVEIGAELRAEHAEGLTVRAPNQPLVTVSTDLVRPWIQACFGYKGFIVPMPFIHSKVMPITKLIVSRPLYFKGGEGDQGALREGINTPQISLQVGIRF